ncbi:MAG: PLP-dependent aminotransferase family protein [Oscillospiraceae bacterium]|nr:PLP-dependent aminotransferase family protein [Oscillospiraceae bacterium]
MKSIKACGKRRAYLQVYKQIRQDIIDGVFEHGSKLPSKRLLADELGLSTVTIEHAYSLLCDEGYALAKERSGYFVIFRKEDGFAAAISENTSPSPCPTAGIKSGSFSAALLAKTMRKVLSDRQEHLLDKSPNPGIGELRQAISRYLKRTRGIETTPEQIIIGSGAEYLYRLIAELLGRDKLFAIEFPSYNKIEQVYRSAELDYQLLPLAHDGIDSAALASSSAQILHTTPYRSFPSGVTATASKRHEYIRWASKGERYIIEDDYESEFHISSTPRETLFSLSDLDNVIYLNTFSKTISPALRAAYMVLPKKLLESFEERLGFLSCTVPSFEQYVLTELINNGDFERHINRVRRHKRRENEIKTAR